MNSIRHAGGLVLNAMTRGLVPLEDVLSLFTEEQNGIFEARFVNLGRSSLRVPRVIVPVGFPGSGKSTWVSRYLEMTDRPTVVISSDDQVERYAEQHGMTYPQAIAKIDMKEFESVMTGDIRNAVAERKDIIIDRTNLRVRPRNRWLSQIPRHYVRMCLQFDVPNEELHRRLDDREKLTGKYIPKNVLADMMETIQEPTLTEFDIIEVLECL